MKDPIYQPSNVALFEAIYGKNLISLGGTAAINNMFRDIDLKGRLLDLGFGLGGVAFYLARKYHCEIKGVEVHPWMIAHAHHNAPIDIKEQLEFATYNEKGEIPFKNDHFDLVYSKGVMNHIHDKESLFLEINRVLKPAGKVLIADWIHHKAEKDPFAPLVKETKQSYQIILENAGFKQISFRDDSEIFSTYIRELLDKLHARRTYLEHQFGQTTFEEVWDQHQRLIQQINDKEKFAIRILCQKG